MAGIWQRARSDAQKEQRRATLLHAAARLLENHAVDAISLNAIAREANISKANVYRYFESREELFLHLTVEALEAWRSSLLKRLERLGAKGDAAAVGRAIAETLAEHENFARLMSVLTTVLERNVSTDVIANFKLGLVERIGDIAEAVRGALPELSVEDAQYVVKVAHFQSAALWPAAHPTEAVAKALERPELAGVCVNFEPDLARAIELVIKGLRSEKDA